LKYVSAAGFFLLHDVKYLNIHSIILLCGKERQLYSSSRQLIYHLPKIGGSLG